MPCRRVDVQASRAVQGQIILGKDDRINVVVINCSEVSSVRKCICRAIGKRDKYLVCLSDVDWCRGRTVHVHAI